MTEMVQMLVDVVKTALEKKASDIHFKEDQICYFRIGDRLVKDIDSCVDPAKIRAIIMDTLSEAEKEILHEVRQLDYSYDLPEVCRLRGNVFFQRGKLSAVYRIIPLQVPTAEELGVPRQALDFAVRPRGLVVVAGPGGAGKSTTVAAMVDHINSTKRDHILTIEDPIEFVYTEKQCAITQREVKKMTRSFAAGLKYALRQDPDVVIISDMRDLETVSTAITMAETGHLVITAVHTTGACETIDRIINMFPSVQQEQVRTQISLNIQGILSQMLLPRADGNGRTAIFEVLVPTFGLRNVIRKGDLPKLKAAHETASKDGSISMDRAIRKALEERRITQETHDKALKIYGMQ